MGVGYPIEADGLLYQVVDDVAIAYQAIFTSALVDETTGGPIVSVPLLNADLPKLSLRAADGGLIAGAAYVEQVFPKLSTAPYTFHVAITAAEYGDATLTVNVPIASTFPVQEPPVIMRRKPVRVQGRVVKASDRAPLSGAVVSSKNGKTPLLRDPVRFPHAAGITVSSLSFAATGPARKVTAEALSTSSRLLLDSTAGLAPGNHLQIGDAAAAEIYEVSVVGPDPGLVVLTSALTTTFAVGAPVQQLTPSATSAATTLARSSDAGDGVLTLVAALSDKGIVISDGPATEYHWLSAISAATGYYRADGIAGVKSLELLCSAAGFTTGDQPWFPQYSDSVNVVDFRLRP
jgi:hypothetical protein